VTKDPKQSVFTNGSSAQFLTFRASASFVGITFHNEVPESVPKVQPNKVHHVNRLMHEHKEEAHDFYVGQV